MPLKKVIKIKIRNLFLFLIFIILYQTHLFALEKKKLPSEGDEWIKKVETLKWKNENLEEHFTTIKKANAKVFILENEIYLDNFNDINQFSWWAFGHAAGDENVLFIRGDGYDIYVDFIEAGYTKVDDWKNINSKDLLDSMKKIAESNADYLKQRGLSYVKQIDWIFKPNLNNQNKSVNYSYKVTWSDGEETMESKNIILAKKGHLETAWVLAYNKDLNFQDEANFSKEFAEGIVFDEGFKYSDYKPGDKLAAVGIGGLVAGSLGVKAIAKSGLLVKLAKFWWILLAPLAFMGRFLSGKESSSSSRGRRRKR